MKRNNEWRLRQPLFLIVEKDDDFIVSDEIFWQYGMGRTISKAVTDYQNTLIHYYRLIERQARDYPANRKLLEKLQDYIVPIEPEAAE